MRYIIMAWTVLALALASPALANDDDGSVWYRLAGASDGSSTLYLLKDGPVTLPDRGWTLVPFMTTRAGPGVTDGVFAQYRTIFFKCNEGTMGLYGYINYYRTGEVADSNTDLAQDDVQFTPIDMGSQFGLAYQIVCGSLDVNTLPATGNVNVAQLIENDVAAYDAKAGQPYAY